MSDLRPELYEGREQTYVKHFVLENYLEKLAYKIGWTGATLNYIDGFAGPWQCKGENLEDTSPHIAVRVLRSVREQLKLLQRPELVVRAMFVEKELGKFNELKKSFAKPSDVQVEVRSGEFESTIDDAVKFGSVGPRSFAFTFIDPCGWTGYGLDAITPLLVVRPGEVLINFMYDEINRFIDHPDPANAATFADLYGSASFRDAWVGLNGLDRQESIVGTYCSRIRECGDFKHVVSAVIINPLQDRTHYHLVYATRHDEGLKTFRDIERAALRQQSELRAGAQKRKRQARTGGQTELFGAEAFVRPYIDDLRDRYQAAAMSAMRGALATRDVMPFDELAVIAMQSPMTSEQDARDLLMEDVKQGAFVLERLSGKQRTPQWGRGHYVRRVRE